MSLILYPLSITEKCETREREDLTCDTLEHEVGLKEICDTGTNYSFILKFFFNVSECFAACMYMDHVCVCLEPEGGIRIPGIGATDSYESPRAWWDKPRFSLEVQQEFLSLSHVSRPSQVIL